MMKTPEITIEQLLDLIAMNEQQVIESIASFFESLHGGHHSVITDDYIYLDAGHPVCLVAHIDTVRPEETELELIVNNGVLTNSKGILGADDRAGVYALMEVATHLDMNCEQLPSLLFTNHEEGSWHGVRRFIESGCLNTNGLRLFVAFDHCRRNEYVFYWRSLPLEVREYLESFGYREACGSVTDVAELMDSTGIPAVNLSIGYYDEHTPLERLVIEDMNENIQRGKEICLRPIESLYRME